MGKRTAVKVNFLKIFANLIRATLLLMAVFAILVSIVWVYEKPVVDKLENEIKDRYLAYYQAEFDRCKEQLNSDGPKGVKAFEEFIESIQEIKKQDRLFPLKRQAFRLIADAMSEREDRANELRWVQRWAAYDERDVEVQLRLALLMTESPDLREEGIKRLANLYLKIPENKGVTERYAEALFKNKQYADAFLTIEKLVLKSASLTQRSWQVFWSTGEKFNADQKVTVIPSYNADNSWEMMFDLPPGVRKIRIDPPSSVPLVIANLRATRTAPIPTQQIEIARLPLKLHQMEQYGVLLHSSGGKDPFFFWDVPNFLATDNMTSWQLSAVVRAAPPPMYRNLFRPDIAEKIRSTLLSKGDREAFQRYTQMFRQQTGSI